AVADSLRVEVEDDERRHRRVADGGEGKRGAGADRLARDQWPAVAGPPPRARIGVGDREGDDGAERRRRRRERPDGVEARYPKQEVADRWPEAQPAPDGQSVE